MAHKAAPVIVVDARGTVSRVSAAAHATLGPSVGRRCSEVVRVRGLRGEPGCHAQCVAELTGGGGSQSHVGTVRGEVHRVSCSSVGDGVVVVLEPVDAELPDASLPSARELQVLARVATGMTNQQVADELGLSFATVRTHMEHVRARLGARTRAEAVAKAVGLGLLGRG